MVPVAFHALQPIMLASKRPIFLLIGMASTRHQHLGHHSVKSQQNAQT